MVQIFGFGLWHGWIYPGIVDCDGIYKVIIDYYPIKLEGHKGGAGESWWMSWLWWLAVSALYILAFKWQSYAIGIWCPAVFGTKSRKSTKSEVE